MRKLYFLLVLFLCTHFSQAQTTLAAGDIVIVGWNSVDNNVNTPGNAYVDDDIDFLLLRNIAAGTEIFFTDLGWIGTGFQQNQNNGCTAGNGAVNDGAVKWTATTDMTAGTQVRVGVKYGLIASSGTVTSVLNSVGTNGGPTGTTPPNVSLATASDQIYAFQGSLATPTLIAAVNYGTAAITTTLTACQLTSTQSLDPAAAVGGYSFLYNSTLNNNYYNGTTTGNSTTIRAAVLNAANWIGSDVTSFTFPLAVTFPLPVRLTDFGARKTEAGIVLEWTVGNEENFNHYEVETSVDGSTYRTLGTVAAEGRPAYAFTTSPVQSSYQLYRLKLVDNDGRYAYSKVLRIDQARLKAKLLLFPNPAPGTITVSSGEPILSVSLADVSGKTYWQQTVGNRNSTSFDLSGLKEGVYLLTVRTTSGVLTERIYKKGN